MCKLKSLDVMMQAKRIHFNVFPGTPLVTPSLINYSARDVTPSSMTGQYYVVEYGLVLEGTLCMFFVSFPSLSSPLSPPCLPTLSLSPLLPYLNQDTYMFQLPFERPNVHSNRTTSP